MTQFVRADVFKRVSKELEDAKERITQLEAQLKAALESQTKPTAKAPTKRGKS